jgi:drug/metabolite transporter (DMT)-like permease
MHPLFGPFMVVLFCLSQALRDVYLAHVFQGVSLFALIILAFAPSTLAFGALAALQDRSAFARLNDHWRTVLAMNITTALAWTSYFFGLTHIEPSVVNTLHSGVGPLTVIALAAMGFAIAGKQTMGRPALMMQAGLAATLAGLWIVVLGGWAGLVADPARTLLALALLMLSGASITISHLYAKRMHEAGFNAAMVTASRYFIIMIVAALALYLRGDFGNVASVPQAMWLGLAGALLIALPLYALQIGIAHSSQMTAHIIRSLGPVFVFALEQFDPRIAFSTPVLILILAYSLFAIGANLAHGWRK